MAEKKVLGFQIESTKIRFDRPGDDSDSSWESCYDSEFEEVEEREIFRTELPVEGWCKCKKYVVTVVIPNLVPSASSPSTRNRTFMARHKSPISRKERRNAGDEVVVMPTEFEIFCCHELEAAQEFDLEGIFSYHQTFSGVLLSKK